ncbi:putative bifunctional diguanylate cyclase/phosphodiesterase [Pseudohoeflea suaedae]|nr:EAL domain-containing protein [Pseudohoeflea suaedae]
MQARVSVQQAKTDETAYYRREIHSRVVNFRKVTWLLALMVGCALGLMVVAVPLAYGLLDSPWLEVAGVATGGAGAFLLMGAAYIKRRVDVDMTRLIGDFKLAHARQDTDALTGAFVRNRFLADLSEAILRSRGEGGAVALLVFDVDHFKQINDGFGHPVGDAVLEFCVRCARKTFPGAVVGRMGGDEFAVFIEHDSPISVGYIDQACGEFLAGLREGFHIGHRRQTVSSSIGIAMSPGDATRADLLFGHADIALYEAKRAGRGTWRFFRPEILADKRQERFVERELRAAILMQELKVLYQPIVNSKGDLKSLEALVRWDHSSRGRINPNEFIPIAERSRLIHDLGMAVLRQVCMDMAGLPNVRVNVNVSARQLQLGHFKEDYIAILAEADVDPSRITLEITESSLLEASDVLKDRIGTLRDAGFSIALDDFGMGYSEFNQLRTLPFDIIKIDKSYTQSLGVDKVTDIFVSAVVSVATHLDRQVVAEGVETEADISRASAAGCGLFQGHLFDKPLTAEAVGRKYARPGSSPVTRASSAA